MTYGFTRPHTPTPHLMPAPMSHEDAIGVAELRGRRDGVHEAIRLLAVEVLHHERGVAVRQLREVVEDLRARASRLAEQVDRLERRRG